jgi:ATP-binding cassette subfamily F protein 3
VLKEAIRDFDGTVIIVSHDRHFLDGLVTKVYEFGDGKVCEHLGGIYDFLAAKNAQNINEAVAATAAKSVAKDAPKQQSDNRLSYEAEKQLMKQRRKVERRVEENERAVNELESAIAAVEALMSTPEGGADAKNYERYASLKKQLNEAMNEWEASMEELDNLETNR